MSIYTYRHMCVCMCVCTHIYMYRMYGKHHCSHSVKGKPSVERVKMKPRVIQGAVGRTEYFQRNLVVHFVCSCLSV